MCRVEGSTRNERRDNADVATPVAAGMIDRDGEIDIEPPSPALELLLEKDVVRLTHADQEDEAAEAGALGKEAVDRRTKRGEAKTAGDDHHVGAGCLLDRPAKAVRSAHADRVAGLESRQGLRDTADGPDCVNQPSAIGRVAADRDRRLADAERIEHVELAG